MTIAAGQIALSLFGLMLVPLAIGLVVRWRWEAAASEIKGPLAQVSNVSLVLLLVLMLGPEHRERDRVVRQRRAAGGADPHGRGGRQSATCSAARAATPAACWRWGPPSRTWPRPFVVADGSFADQPDVIVFLAGAGLIVLVIVFPLAAELGKRASART